MLDQLRTKHILTLGRKDDSIARQELQWTLQCHRGRGQPKNTWKGDLQKVMWTVCFNYSWNKMEGGRTELETSDMWPMFHEQQQGITSRITFRDVNYPEVTVKMVS